MAMGAVTWCPVLRMLWLQLPTFLKKRGWQTGQPWGFEVENPEGMSISGEGRRNKKALSSWISQGVVRADGSALIQGNLSRVICMRVYWHLPGANGPVFFSL